LGHLPKHIKVKRFQRTMRLIAMAALAGCVYEERITRAWRLRHDTSKDPRDWGIIYPDGKESASYHSKTACARRYLKWFLGRHDALSELERLADRVSPTGRLAGHSAGGRFNATLWSRKLGKTIAADYQQIELRVLAQMEEYNHVG